MKNKIALLVYPEFSFQEIGNTIALFKWYFNSPTVVFSSSSKPVKSEEGIIIYQKKHWKNFVFQIMIV